MDKQSVKRCHSEAGREQEKDTRPDGSEGLFFSGKFSEYVTPVYKSPPFILTRGGKRGVGGRGERDNRRKGRKKQQKNRGAKRQQSTVGL